MFSDSEVTLVRACTQGTYALDRKTNLRSNEFGNHLHKKHWLSKKFNYS